MDVRKSESDGRLGDLVDEVAGEEEAVAVLEGGAPPYPLLEGGVGHQVVALGNHHLKTQVS